MSLRDHPDWIRADELAEWRAAGFTDPQIRAYRCMGIAVAKIYRERGDYDTPSSKAMRERVDHDPFGMCTGST